MKNGMENIKKSFKGRRAWVYISGAAAFCLIFALVLVITVINSNAKVVYVVDPSELIAGDYTDSPKLADSLNGIFAGDIDLMASGTEYIYPVGSVMNNSKMFTVTSNKGSSVRGYQCFIYANAVYNKLFGEYVSHGTGLLNSVNVIENKPTASYALFTSVGVRCGAYMRTTENADGSYSGSKGHSLIILTYDKDTITFIEGNGDGKGLVRAGIMTWDDFNTRMLTGRNRVICHVTQPVASYYDSLYGNSYITVSYQKGASKSGTVPVSKKIKYRQDITLPGPGDLSCGSDIFAGWYCQRPDSGLIANTAGGWSTPDEIASGKARKRIFKADSVINFNSYFYYSSGTHLRDGQSVNFVAEWTAPPTARPDAPITFTSACSVSGGYVNYTIDVKDNPGCSYLEIVLDVPEGLKIESIENGVVLGGLYAGDATEVISWKMAGDLCGTGRLINVKFKYDSAASYTGKSIGFKVLTCCNEFGDVEFSPETMMTAIK